MKKDKNIVISIILFFVILLYSSIKILTKDIGNMDEIWNYNFANQIANGLLPYKDFNIITTPLLPLIVSVFLRIYNSLLTMRIVSIIISTLSIFLVYKILDKLKISLSVVFTIIISLFYFNYYYLEYNFFCLFLNLFIIYLELAYKDSKNKHFIIGLLASLVLLNKQTVGLLTFIAIVIYQLIINYKNNNKIFNKNLLYRLLGFIIPIIIFVLYLLFNNILYDFIDYTILGISTFSSKISYLNLIRTGNIVIKLLAIIIPICYLFILYTYIKKKDNNLLIIGAISIAMFSLVYPISDVTHFCVAIIIVFVVSIYSLSLYINISKNLLLKYISIISMILLVVLSSYTLFKNKNKYICHINHFEYLPISKDLEDEIITIDNYINDNTYILNYNAALYMISLDRYNKNYDLFMSGNFGLNGIDNMLNDINNSNRTYLITTKKKNWQNPNEITDYVENNFNKVDEILYYKVYKK